MTESTSEREREREMYNKNQIKNEKWCVKCFATKRSLMYDTMASQETWAERETKLDMLRLISLNAFINECLSLMSALDFQLNGKVFPLKLRILKMCTLFYVVEILSVQ
jgi:hypothetical protein